MRVFPVLFVASLLAACASTSEVSVEGGLLVPDSIIASPPVSGGAGAPAPIDSEMNDVLPLGSYGRSLEVAGDSLEPPETPYRVHMGGAEPYWRASGTYYQRDSRLVLDFSIIAVDESPVQVRLMANEPYLAEGDRFYSGRDPEGRPIRLSMQAGPCVDDNGILRGFLVSLDAFERYFEGCGREDGGQWEWSRLVPQYPQAIATCLNEFSGPTGVVDIYTPSSEAVAIRLIDADEGRYECTVRLSDNSPSSIRELSAVDIHLNEGRTVFLPGLPSQPDDCRQYEHVRYPDGQMLGVLAHDICVNPRRYREAPDLPSGES